MPAFETPRDRDAFATIRGFVYQVDLTIERWLTLGPEDVLELERGEDIDLIVGALRLPEEERERILEQVKHREEGLTLRSTSAIDALASAVELRAANPMLALRFRYTTNAKVGVERPSPIPSKESAIICWMRCREGGLAEADRAQILKGIHLLLSQASKPPKLANETWLRFQQEFATFQEERLLALIHAFEWSVGAPPADGLAERLMNLLVSSQRAADTQAARAVYQRLFLFVFKLLTQPGSKRLTVALLREQLAQLELSPEDQYLLQNLVIQITALDARVSVLEGRSLDQAIALAEVRTQVETMARDYNVVAAPDLSAPYTPDPPPLPKLLVRRDTAVHTIVEALRERRWVALHGGVHVGKTTLAALAGRAIGGHPLWFRLRGLTAPVAAARLDATFGRVTAEQVPFFALQPWYARVTEILKLKGVSLIVLDDAPRLRPDDELAARIAWLAEGTASDGLRILSTGEHPVGDAVAQHFGLSDVLAFRCQDFDDDDAAEVFRMLGVPAGVVSSDALGELNRRAAGHPEVLWRNALRLKANGWEVERTLEEAREPAGTTGLEVDLNARMAASLKAPEDRELLHRLRLIGGSFSAGEVDALAAAAPPLSQARERLMRLVGDWIQERGDGRFVVSPLLSELPSYLPTGTNVACHKTLAGLILCQKTASISEFVLAVRHLLRGGETTRAAVTLVIVLEHLRQAPPHVPVGEVLDFWWSTPLPAELPIDVRLMLRAHQVLVGRRFGRDVTALLPELDALLQAHDGVEPSMRAGFAALLALDFSQSDFGAAFRFASRLIDMSPNGLRVSLAKEGEHALDVDTIVWHVGASVTTPHELRAWTELMARVPAVLRSRIGEDPQQLSVVFGVADRLWMRELERVAERRMWVEVRVATQQLATRARELGVEVLWAAATGAVMIITAEYEGEVDRAVALSREAFQGAQGAQTRYILHDAIGRQQLYAKRYAEASGDLLMAVSLLDEAPAYMKVHTLLSAGEALASGDAPRSILLVEEAVRAATDVRVPATEAVAALGELVIARWYARDLREAFEAASHAVEVLDTAKDVTSDRWKRVAISLANALTFIVRSLTEPPGPAPGEQPLKPPARGLFLRFPSLPPGHDYEVLLSGLALYLARFARVVGDLEQVRRWAFAGFERGRGTSSRASALVVAMLALEVLPVLFSEERLAEAIGVADEHSEALASVRNPTATPLPRKVDLVIWAALLPVSFAIASIAVQDRGRARTVAEALVRICRPMFPNEPVWSAAVAALTAIYMEQENFDALVERGNVAAQAGVEMTAVIAFVGASLCSQVVPEQAIQLHVRAAASAWEGAAPVPGLREPILKFLDSYWRDALQRTAHRFRSPRLVRDSLEMAGRSSVATNAAAMLLAIVEGLGITLNDTARAWLASGRNPSGSTDA